MTDLARLKAPFDPARISWRVGSTTADKSKGMALGYIDARDVMERLDDVCGPGGWQCSYPHANGKTVCAISIKIGDEWVSKADGAGDTDFEAEKGALSDAFKRAAVRWGIGRYLYDLPTPWVAIEQRGKSFIIKDGEYTRLTALLNKGSGGSSTPAPLPSPEPGPNTAAADPLEYMLAEIGRIDSIQALVHFKKDAGALARYNRLNDKGKDRVHDALEAREAFLAPKQAAE